MQKIKLSEWAKKQGLSYRTAWNHVKSGLLKDRVEINEAGSIFILEKIEEDPDITRMITEIYKVICK